MSVYSEPLSTSFRTVDFSFCFDSPSFSDCIVVLTTLRHAAPSMYRQLLGSAKQLALATVQLTADTVASVNDTAASRMADMSSWISSSTSLLSSWVQPVPTSGSSKALVVTHTLHVSSAVLAAASPYFKQLLEQPPQLPCKLVAAAARASSSRRGSGWGSSNKRILALQLLEGRGAAAAAIIKYMFTNTLQMKDVYEALDLLVVSEQLQVQEAAEECLHYLECRPLDWPLCLTLLHLQYQQQQQQQQQQVMAATPGVGAGGMSASCAQQQQQEQQLQRGRSLLTRWPLQQSPVQEPLQPPLPLPSSSASLSGLLQRARQHLLSEFEDFEAVWATAEGRGKFLALPLPAVVTLLGDPALQVASENTVLLAVACWLQEHSNEATHGFPPAAGGAAAADLDLDCIGSSQQQGAPDQGPQLDQQGAGAAHGARRPAATAAEQLLGLVHVAQLSYTYLLHVLPLLPALQGCSEVVQQLQREALWYKAAGRERQAYIAASAAASQALASSLGSGSDEGAAGTPAAAASSGGARHRSGSSISVPTVEVQLAAGAAPAAVSGGAAAGWMSPSKWHATSPGPSSRAASDAGSEAGGLQRPFAPRVSRRRLLMQEAQASPMTMYSVRPASMASGYQFKVQLALADLLAAEGGNGGNAGHATTTTTTSSSSSSGGEWPHSRLLGGGSIASACCTLPGQWYGGFVWNVVVAGDGFVGLMWHVSADARGGKRLVPGPVPEAEVGVMFSLWVEQPPLAASYQARAGSSGSLAAAAEAGLGGGSPSKAPVAPHGQQQLAELRSLHEGRSAAAAGGGVEVNCAAEGEQVQRQHSYGAGAFTTPQYVPCGCACGFSAFLGPGLELLRGAPREVLTLLCRLQLCD